MIRYLLSPLIHYTGKIYKGQAPEGIKTRGLIDLRIYKDGVIFSFYILNIISLQDYWC